MSDTETVIVVKAIIAKTQRKAKKEFEIKQKYNAKLAASYEKSFTPSLPQSRLATIIEST